MIVMDSTLENELEKVTQKIIDAFNPLKIILFGSQAYGLSNQDSDVDILIVMESNERPTERATRVSRLLRPRPFPMDILVRTPEEIHRRLTIGDHFIEDILRQGKILYER
jgi:predicted nucleotidyltransferase